MVAQNAILLFLPVKFNFCRKKSVTKFLCMKTSSSNIAATSFLYLTVHRWIAGDVPICQKFHPLFQKTPIFYRFFNSTAAVRASVKRSIIANRKSTMCFQTSRRWTLCVTHKSPKCGSKRNIFKFGVVFQFFFACCRRHLKLNMWVEHSKSQPVCDKTSLK